MKSFKSYIASGFVAISLLANQSMFAQSVLYPSQFDLSEVTLLDSPFSKAQTVNYNTLLAYDVDRMLTPFIRQAGLSQTTDENSRYYNWEFEHHLFDSWAWNPVMAMDGHASGHYLSALSMSYASCQDPTIKSQLKKRVDYMVEVLCDCQAVFDNDTRGLKGFIGGVPDNEIWRALADGDYRVYNQHGNWVPLYCEHKIMAGLRDAFVYAGNEDAKEAFRKMCDWSIDIVKLFHEDIMEMQILQWEPGGMNEVLADAFCLFGDKKYLTAAQKYSHQIMIENMVRDDYKEFLDQKNVNEAAAKFVGFARINELKSDKRYGKAVSCFWEDVVSNRSAAIGGVGVSSFFAPASKGSRYITEANGPDACATYNMLKLTERMFTVNRNARLTDYYEKALINHILGNQDPETGGYVFYTSLRPESYRIYSKVNEAMWCCVGTGMESQSKYGEFIYTMSKDTLFVNLFVASELNSNRAALRQETQFPYGQTSKITINKSGSYVLAIRRPEWTNAGYSVKVNGKSVSMPKNATGSSYYVPCGKNWNAGDVVEVSYPMTLGFSECPRVPTYIALKYGPTVLAGVTETSTAERRFFNEYAGEGKNDNSNSQRQKFQSLALAPMLITERGKVPQRVKVLDASTMTFEFDASAPGSRWKNVKLMPFFAAQHSKYTVYFNQQTEAAWLRNPLYLSELKTFEIERNTFDVVTVGEPSSERAHAIRTSETSSAGTVNEKTFRDCQPGHWFELTFNTKDISILAASDSLTLLCKFSIADRGRAGIVMIDGTRVKNLSIPNVVKGVGKDKFFDMPVTFPVSMVGNKQQITVRFQSAGGVFFPRLYVARLLKHDPKLVPSL